MAQGQGAQGQGAHGSLAYRADIDGLRGIAVLLVVLYHAEPSWLPGGFIGVDVFFVISGYLITKILHGESAAGTFSYGNFYRRRIKRLLPAFSVVVAATIGLSLWLSLPDHLIDTGQSVIAAGLFATNFLFWNEANYFAGAAEIKPLLHSWSLAVEEQFYFVYPVLLLLAIKLSRARGALVITAVIFTVSLAASALLTPVFSEAAFFLLPFRAWELMLGSLLAITAVQAPASERHRNALVAAGIAMIAAAGVLYSSATPFPGIAALLPVAGSALAIYAGAGSGAVSRIVLQNGPLVFFGRISYSLYLWHWPLLAFARYRSVGEPDLALMMGLVALSVVLAWLSYRFVEQPFRNPARLTGYRPFLFALASSGLMIGAGGAMIHTKGLPQRFDSDVRELIATRADRDRRAGCMASAEKPRDPADPCLYGSPDTEPTIALWGDSHAHALVDSLGRVAADDGRSLQFYGYAGCPPITDVEVPDDAGCAAYSKGALAQILNDPQITTVVLFARHAAHLRGDTGALGPAEGAFPPAAFPELSERERIARYFAALDSMVARLRAGGRQVVLVQPVPETAFDIPRIAALLAMQGKSIADFTRPRAQYEARQAGIRDSLEAIAARHGARLVDPAAWMCDAAVCRVEQEGRLLYYDDDHVTSFAATRIGRDIFGNTK